MFDLHQYMIKDIIIYSEAQLAASLFEWMLYILTREIPSCRLPLYPSPNGHQFRGPLSSPVGR
jgi:hypothetical protein